MTKFNTNKTPREPDTLNHERQPVFTLSAKLELVKLSSLAFLEDQFYRSGKEQMERIQNLIKIIVIDEQDPEFVLKVAAYSRKEFWLRSFPVMLLAEASFYEDCTPFLRKYAKHILTRADMPLELLSYIIGAKGSKKGIRKQIKLAINDVANSLDRYQFGKYKASNKTLSWKDTLKICHPIPKDKGQHTIFKDVIEETIREQGTWESAKSSGANWDSILLNFNVGYMALLKNLRNIKEDDSVNEDGLAMVLATIQDPKQVATKRQFPFRYLSAYREIDPATANKERNWGFGSGFDPISQAYDSKTIAILKALRVATEHSLSNIPTMAGQTVIACDVSGSMDQAITTGKPDKRGKRKASKISCNNVGAVFGAGTLLKNPTSLFYIFGEYIQQIPYVEGRPLFDTINFVANGGDIVGHATNGHLVIDDLLTKRYFVDRIIVFTDLQMWDTHYYYDSSLVESMKRYWKDINPKAKLVLVDLTAYGKDMFPENYPNVLTLSGYNDKMLKFVEMTERDPRNMVKMVNDYQY